MRQLWLVRLQLKSPIKTIHLEKLSDPLVLTKEPHRDFSQPPTAFLTICLVLNTAFSEGSLGYILF